MEWRYCGGVATSRSRSPNRPIGETLSQSPTRVWRVASGEPTPDAIAVVEGDGGVRAVLDVHAHERDTLGAVVGPQRFEPGGLGPGPPWRMSLRV